MRLLLSGNCDGGVAVINPVLAFLPKHAQEKSPEVAGILDLRFRLSSSQA